jgi:hypothetical protein
VRSGATGHVAAPKPTSAGRCGPKLQLTWQRVDARLAPYLDLELVCGGTRSSGCRLPSGMLHTLLLCYTATMLQQFFQLCICFASNWQDAGLMNLRWQQFLHLVLAHKEYIRSSKYILLLSRQISSCICL